MISKCQNKGMIIIIRYYYYYYLYVLKCFLSLMFNIIMKKKKAPLGLKFVFKSEKPAGNASEAATQKQILERRIFESVLMQFNSTFSKGGRL